MNYGKQGLKALGVSLLAALGLMAFGASGASASGFLIEEPPSKVAMVGEGENLLEGRFLILGLSIEISCHMATANGTISSNGHGHATLTFSNCLATETNAAGTKLEGGECKLNNNIVANVLALVILHTNSKPYLLLTPLDGLTFAMVNGAPCMPNANVKGNQVLSISNPDGDDVVKLLSSKGLASLFPSHKLKYGINEAHLEVDALVELAGDHEGMKWGAA